MTSSMSFAQLEKLWVAQGGSPKWSPTMAGIAIAESGGIPTNQYRDNPSPPYGQPGSTQNTTNATGLWQIMPSNFPDQSIPQLEDPSTNAADAVALAGGRGQTNVGAVTSNWDPSQDPVTAAVAAHGGPLTAAQVQAVLAKSGRSTGGGSKKGGTTISLKSPFGSGELLPGGAWDPLNWGTMATAAASNALWNALLPYLIILLGLVFVVVGIAVTFRGHDTLKLSAPSGEGEPEEEAEPKHHLADDAALAAAA